MKSILDMTNAEARSFLLSTEHYCNLDLPSYIDLGVALQKADDIVTTIPNYRSGSPKVGNLDNVNHRLLTNKDGAYSWRPFQIIHPVLYVELVNALTEETNWATIKQRFTDFRADDHIICCSIPFQKDDSETPKEGSILNWWQNVEQASVRLSLQYKYLTITDVTDCYGALYTHTVAWAIHTKPIAKTPQGRDKALLGNRIDDLLQDMQNRQTNGIPQGSTISDFIAEMVLGYADELLSRVLKDKGIAGYTILRYRDDYRIFTQTAEDGKLVLLSLTQILADLNFKLNSSKTHITDDIVTGSIKPDKLFWQSTVKYDKSLFKTLLIIRNLANKYPNSGSLVRALGDFRKRIENIGERPRANDVLIPTIVDIMYSNPRTYPTAASILSKLLSFEEERSVTEYIEKIVKKFEDVPNIGFLDIWLQRMTIKYDRSHEYDEKLSKIVMGSSENLWNLDWLVPDAKKIVKESAIIDEDEIEKIDKVISLSETESFLNQFDSEPDDKEDEDE